MLDIEQEDRYARRPNELAEHLQALHPKPSWVVVDEIQKVPRLLDVIHAQIEQGSVHFAMTGSSARKLKRQSTNLLAGRASIYDLFPFTHTELADAFNLDSALKFGTLPAVWACPGEEEKKAFLRAYALTYLKEEIWAEHWIQNLDPFRRFLEVAAQCCGELINFTNIARDVGADVKTVQSYFQILEDTLVGFLLEPFHQSLRKRQTQAPKFYLFDPGVKRALNRTLNLDLLPGTYDYGKAFEHFVVAEALRLSSYRQNDFRFSYLRTKDGAEIDLMIERPGLPDALIEIKSSAQVSEQDTRTLEKFLPSMKNAEAFCLSRDPLAKQIGSVKALPWRDGLRALGIA